MKKVAFSPSLTGVVSSTLLCFALSACSIFDPIVALQPKPQISSQSLGETYFAPLPLDNQLLPEPSLQQLRQEYANLLPRVQDPETLKIVQYRLADLTAVLAEKQLESGLAVSANGENILQSAVKQYQDLLVAQPAKNENMEVLYQLAKAHEQQGQLEQSYAILQQLLRAFPANPYLAEVYFRLGEIEFNRKQYVAAVAAYQRVLDQGSQSAYYATSAYMLGWSYFKQNQNSQALVAFTSLLDNSLPNDIIAQPMMRQVDSQAQIEALGSGEKRLVNDTLRIMSLLFSYQESQYENRADSIVDHFERAGPRHYEYVLYDQLAQLYLDQGRFRDSAQVYQRFSIVNADHFQAPIFAVKEIDAYILGKFPSLVLPAKQLFVQRYGITGQYWTAWGVLQQERVAPYLNQYLQELANYEHNRAQLLSAKSTQLSQAKQPAVEASATTKTEVSATSVKAEAKAAYLLAAAWYQEFIQTFYADPLSPQIRFSLAEALFSAEQYAQAITTFENYAYDTQTYPKAAEAGYAAILAYRQIQLDGDESSPLSQEQWLDKQLHSQDNFVATFNDDVRASDVLYISMQQRFSLERYLLAIENAQQLLTWQPSISAAQNSASLLVIAHSQFALQDYAAAESSYHQIVLGLANTDPSKADIQEKLAASIYKQGELNIKQNYLPLAVNDFLRVLAVTPQTSIRITAQYDAANYLLEMQQWQQAIGLLEDFKQRFAAHPLAQNIDDKLIFAYQQNEDWQPAADKLIDLWKASPQSEEGRQALYVAAQYFNKIGQTQSALEAYRDYAHAFPLPLAEANEARFILSEMYREENDDAKRRFWLQKLLDADQQAAADPTIGRSDRSRYLAAMSSLVFAQDKLIRFKEIKLSLPLKKSLARKKAAQNSALQAFNQVLDYKVADYVTAANFYLADIYHQLAKDLMSSSKPNNLSVLELEQYELLLEEQAFPFEEQAITLHETNAQRMWQGNFDTWIQQSLLALETLMPARYRKVEQKVEVSNEIF
jgi:tetratricopeptide (TPR) repeat protein